ncbi:MAG: WD40 repeat domain-containing protein [Planctomycetota bacterium]
MDRNQNRRECLRGIVLGACALGASRAVVQGKEPPSIAALANRMLQIEDRMVRLQPMDPTIENVVVTALAYDPRDQVLAAAGDDHLIRIVEAHSLRTVRVLGEIAPSDTSRGTETGHRDLIRTLAFDTTGGRLVSAGNDGQLILWNRDRNYEVIQRIESAPALARVRFSPDGQELAAVGYDPKVYLISRKQTVESASAPECDCTDLRCCAYDTTGARLVVGDRNGYLHLFDPRKREQLSAIAAHRARVRDAAFLPSSNMVVSVGDDGRLVRCDAATGHVLAATSLTTGRLFSLAVIDANHVAAAGSDDRIHVCRIAREASTSLRRDIDIGHLRGHDGSVATLASGNGQLYSGGFDATLRRWDVTLLTGTDPKIALRGPASP